MEYMDPGDGCLHKVSHDEFKNMWTGVLVLLKPNDSFEKADKTTSNIIRFWNLFRPHKNVLIQALFGAVIYSILGLSTSLYIGKVTDYVFVDGNVNLLNLMSIVMVVLLLLQVFIGYIKSILMLKTGQSIDISLILGYYKHILRLPQEFFDTMRVGEITSRIGDAVKIRSFVNNVIIELSVNVLILIITITMMLFYSWQLTLILVASVPFYGFLFCVFNYLNKKFQRRIMETSADLQAQLVESLESVGTIKRFGVENFANKKTESRFIPMLRSIFSASKSTLLVNNGIEIVRQVIVIAVFWIGSIQVVDQTITPGTLMMFYSLVGYVTSSISSLIFSNQSIQEALIAADRLYQIMDLECEGRDMNKIELTTDMIGDIRFEEVCFRYGSRQSIFTNFNLMINHGKTTGIVGESGSGKTTLISILQNIYPIQSGRIKIGNYNIADINNISLRERICIVPQQVELFAGTIVDNIALGENHPDIKRVISIIKELGLESFVEGLPLGLSTVVGEHGVSLSGGERQRIAIARAIYRNSDILLFDEATSSLDTISEKYVKDITKKMAAQGKTIIIIAHRLSTIKDADSIVVIEHGKVCETGTHTELLNFDGVYAKLWNEQTGGGMTC